MRTLTLTLTLEGVRDREGCALALVLALALTLFRVGQAFNMAPQDFLRQLPGVHAHNCRKLMNAVLNLQELSTRSREQLSAVIGPVNGKLLHDFLHREA